MIFKKVLFLLMVICVLTPWARAQVASSELDDLDGDLKAISAKYGSPDYEWAVLDESGNAKMGRLPDEMITARRLGSIGKVIVAMGIMKLLEQGLVDLQAPVADYLPDLALPNPWQDTDPVRVVHLLEHSSGIDDMHFNEYYTKGDDWTLEMALAHNPHSKRIRWRPGTCSAYSNIGYAIAARIIEVVTHASADAWLEAEILQPLGMKDSYFAGPVSGKQRPHDYYRNSKKDGKVTPSIDYMYYPSVGLISTLNDFCLLADFFTKHQDGDADSLLRHASVERMFQHTSTPVAQSTWNDGARGLGFSVGGLANDPEVRASGYVEGHISEIGFLPHHGSCWVWVSHSSRDDPHYISEMTARLSSCLTEERNLPIDTLPSMPAPQLANGEYRYVSLRNNLFAFYDDMCSPFVLTRRGDYSQDYEATPVVGGELALFLTIVGDDWQAWQADRAFASYGGKSPEGMDFFIVAGKYYEYDPSPWPALLRAVFLGYRWVVLAGLLLLIATVIGRIFKRAFAFGALKTSILAVLPYPCGYLGFQMLHGGDPYLLGQVSLYAIGLLALSILLPLASVTTCWTFWHWQAVGFGRVWKWLYLPLILGNLGLCAYLISYGILPFVSWWY